MDIRDFEQLIEDLDDLAAVAERRGEPTVSHSDLVADLETYAERHKTTADQLIRSFVDFLARLDEREIDPGVAGISGIIPQDARVAEEYREYVIRKHT